MKFCEWNISNKDATYGIKSLDMSWSIHIIWNKTHTSTTRLIFNDILKMWDWWGWNNCCSPISTNALWKITYIFLCSKHPTVLMLLFLLPRKMSETIYHFSSIIKWFQHRFHCKQFSYAIGHRWISQIEHFNAPNIQTADWGPSQ